MWAQRNKSRDSRDFSVLSMHSNAVARPMLCHAHAEEEKWSKVKESKIGGKTYITILASTAGLLDC